MILGVSFDTPAENKAFAEKYHFNFPLLCDTDRKIGTAYGANADPQKGAQRVGVVIDRDGKIKEWHARVAQHMQRAPIEGVGIPAGIVERRLVRHGPVLGCGRSPRK